jgi:hypothetical protein
MKEDNKIFWNLIKSKTKAKESIPCILDDEGGINTDDKTKSELLNKFFQSVFTVEADSQNAPTLNQRSNKNFFQSFLFFTSAILLSSFIQGVSYFLDIDLLKN